MLKPKPYWESILYGILHPAIYIYIGKAQMTRTDIHFMQIRSCFFANQFCSTIKYAQNESGERIASLAALVGMRRLAPDPYVPNVVRYQLRYIPISYRCLSITGAKVVLFSICAKYFRVFFMNIANEHRDTKTQSFF